jgi:hypothetical protein
MRRLLSAFVFVLALTGAASAQSLTPAQMATLKAAILADPTLNATPNTYPDGATQLANLLNADAAPDFWVWRTNVSIGEVGRTFNATELAGLTSLNHTRLQTLAIYMSAGVNPSVTATRTFFDDIFSGAGGTNTRAALLVVWRRKARLFEKVFATGTGSTGSPATLGVEGSISPAVAHNARNAGQ